VRWKNLNKYDLLENMVPENPQLDQTPPAPEQSLPDGGTLLDPSVDVDALLATIIERHSSLSNRLQDAARYIIDHPNEMAFETISEVARRAGVQPSVLVRFSQAFGFSGFTEMQKVFQRGLTERAPTYAERVRRFGSLPQGSTASSTVLREFCRMNQAALEALAQNDLDGPLEQAVELLAGSRTVHVLGQRRSHPTAMYLAYALTRAGKQARVMAGAGGTLEDEMRTMQPGDALIAISIHPYSAETVTVTNWALECGVKVVAFTDGPLSPIGTRPHAVLHVRDADWFGFRSIIAQTCLAQVLVIGVTAALSKRT
jgi:DNA-binding MurR/RpiR family transcriptional regulator